jgi:hypothetical protein
MGDDRSTLSNIDVRDDAALSTVHRADHPRAQPAGDVVHVGDVTEARRAAFAIEAVARFRWPGERLLAMYSGLVDNPPRTSDHALVG